MKITGRLARRLVEDVDIEPKIIATNPDYKKDAWLIRGEEVYLAPQNTQMDTTGFPMGKRWECSINHWNRFFDSVMAPQGWKRT